MISLQSIKIKNFLSFAGEHEFTFPSSGLYAIKGQVGDSKENSNGSGKSSFLEAIAYALDYAKLPSTELQSWFAEDAFSVELFLSVNNEEFKIKRNKNNYEVFYQGKQYKAADAKEIIKKTLLDSWLLQFVTYRPQDVSGNFLSLANADRLDFLVNVLELNKFDK